MKIYLVGGTVRDNLLGLPARERDWVVVGATPADLVAQGFKPVGKDFPVFLHPDTHDEYALARTERKTAPGYHGFEFHASPEVSLEEDLRRRDLTINAMARDENGEIIDPFGGRRDLTNRVLRHVSPAFVEDPVRILRVARFHARFFELGFSVADETREFMKNMVDRGEVDALVPERIWQETVRAIAENHPEKYFEILRDCGALSRIFPELEALFGVPQPERHHPEIDTGIHTMMVLRQAARLSDDPTVRFAALTHDLGKGETPPETLPGHRGHEKRGVRLVRAMSKRLRIPREYRDLAVRVAEFHCHCHRALELKSSTKLKVMEALDAFRNPARFEKFLLACEADARGRKGLEEDAYPQADVFRNAFQAAAAIGAADVGDDDLSGRKLGDQIRKLRIRAIEEAIARKE